MRIIWLYEKSHQKHPFISTALHSLTEAGFDVIVIDKSAAKAKGKPYRHIALADDKHAFYKAGAGHLSFYRRLILRLFRTAYLSYAFLLRMEKNRYEITWKNVLPMLCCVIMVKPEVIIATTPVSLLAGWLAARLVKARIVYYPFELYGEQEGQFSTFWKRMESRVLSRGVHSLITQNDERAKIYVHERGARVVPTVVHNYKRRRSVKRSGKLREELNMPAGCRVVLYEGWLIKGRWLEHLIESVGYLSDEVRLVLMGKRGTDSYWSEIIEPLLQKPEIAKKVCLMPWIDQSDLLDYVADADVGVIIYDDRVRNNYYCEPGKLSDYVQAGVPVVAPDFPTIGPVIERHGIGASFNSPEPVEIARAINSVLAVPREGWQPALAKASKEMIWETQLPDFLKAVVG